MLSPVLTALRGLVFPPVCEGCGAMTPASLPEPVCTACAGSLRPIAEPACPLCARHWPAGGKCPYCEQQKHACDAVYAAFAYDGALKSVLHAYKFARRRALGPFLARHLGAFARMRLKDERFDAVIAVPSDAAKTADRGFRPTAELAREISKTLGVPDKSSWLGARGGRAQVALTREQRRQNVRGRFFFRGDPSEAAGRAALLVDDVLTTGSTIAECAWVLQGAGVASVAALCLARGEMP